MSTKIDTMPPLPPTSVDFNAVIAAIDKGKDEAAAIEAGVSKTDPVVFPDKARAVLEAEQSIEAKAAAAPTDPAKKEA